MGSLKSLFVFEDEGVDPEQLSQVWERFDDISDGGEWKDHLHNPSKKGYVVGDGPYDLNARVGKDMIVGELYANGVNKQTRGVPDLPFVELRIEEALFKRSNTEDRRKKHADALVDILREVYFALDPHPKLVYAMADLLTSTITDSFDEMPADAESLQKGEINYLTWLTVFTPPLVETYGRDTLLSAPVWRTYEWKDGSIVLVPSPDPLAPEHTRDLHEHLGLDYPW